MARAWIGLGSNLGDRVGELERGLSLLAGLPGTALAAVSSAYDTAPVGPDQPRFLNAVAGVETTLPPEALLRELLRIEALAGRERRERWGPRTLDLDLLVYGDRVETTADLALPHPRMLERAFVLLPLAEIAPELVVPGRTETARALAARVAAGADVRSVGTLAVRRGVSVGAVPGPAPDAERRGDGRRSSGDAGS